MAQNDFKLAWRKLLKAAKDLPLDYSFMDQQYALQHKKQQELQVAFNSFASLSVIIAALGLFSMAAYQAALRKKRNEYPESTRCLDKAALCPIK